MVGNVERERVGIEHIEGGLGAVGADVGQVRQGLHGVPHGVGAEVERQAVVALVAVGVGDGLKVEGLLGLGLHRDGQGLRHEDFAAQHGQEVLLGITELSRVGCEAEGQKAQIILSLHLPAHFLAATRLDGFHWYRAGP